MSNDQITPNTRQMKIFLSVRSIAACCLMLVLLAASCSKKTSETPKNQDSIKWNPDQNFHLIDKEENDSLKYLDQPLALDSVPIRQLVYLAVNTDIYIRRNEMRIPLTNTLCIRNVNVDAAIVVNKVEYYDAEGIKLVDYLKKPVELAPLQSIWLIVGGQKSGDGTGVNFIIDWASETPAHEPIIESLMAGSSYQLGFSYKSESVVVKEWRYGVETPVEEL